MSDESTRAALEHENRLLRERLAALELEREEEVRRALAAVAHARSRVYWLDRYRIDLDRVMTRSAAQRTLDLARSVRRHARRVRGLMGR